MDTIYHIGLACFGGGAGALIAAALIERNATRFAVLDDRQRQVEREQRRLQHALAAEANGRRELRRSVVGLKQAIDTMSGELIFAAPEDDTPTKEFPAVRLAPSPVVDEPINVPY